MLIKFRRITLIAFITSLLVMSGLSASAAEESASINIAEFHQILDAINKAKIPESVKDQLYRDMKASMIENVRQAKIPQEVKSVLIKDLQSTTRN